MNLLPDESVELHIARDYVANGISVIPLRLDGTKRPAVESWQPFSKRLPTDDELKSLFSSVAGIGIPCGVVSGGLEVFDFDEDADRVFGAWWDQLPPAIRGRLAVIETGGGGYHVPFRCSEICGNKKIAFPVDRRKPYIETRGQGGYIVGVGSPLTVHESGHPYIQVRGVPLPELPRLTPTERKTIWTIARTFDESKTTAKKELADWRKRRSNATVSGELDQSKPWDDFDIRAEWADVLTPAGWSTETGETWRRPNKRLGVSAKVVIAKNGCEVLRVFTSSAHPLESETTYGKFQAFKLLYHGGDSSAAAKAVRALGYGKRESA